jgi:hypothetical protein
VLSGLALSARHKEEKHMATKPTTANIQELTICGAPIEQFSIVMPLNPTEAEQYAAGRLQRYIAMATGKALPFAEERQTAHKIYIGAAARVARETLKHDGFTIRTDDTSLHLAGAIDRGTIYAVNTFLEKYVGVRIYEGGVERVLPAEKIAVPAQLSVTENPVFQMRRTSHATTADPDYAVWMKFNSSLARLEEKHGGTIVNAPGLSCHTFEKLCPPEQYFEEHPEYYSLIDGKRIIGGNKFDKPYGQLCLTNPDVLHIVTENVLKQIALRPDCQIADVSQNDNSNYCRCENCAAVDKEEGSPAGLMLRFVNAIAAEVKKKYPNVLVQTFAYQYTRKPPKITKPADNVIVRLCSIECCFRHKLDCGCAQNESFAEDMAGWGKIAKNLSIWNYTVNYDEYYAPWPNFDALPENARYFAENNAVHVYEQSSSNGGHTGEFGALRTYLIGKLLWNPYMSREEYNAHIDEFLEGYFGPGWQGIRAYLDLLMETTKDQHIAFLQPLNPYSQDPDYETRMSYEPAPYQKLQDEHYLSEFFTHLPDLLLAWRKALAKAPDNATRFRIIRAMMSLDYIELFCTPHDRATMTLEEQAAYEARCAEFLWKQELFGQHTTENTARRKKGQG